MEPMSSEVVMVKAGDLLRSYPTLLEKEPGFAKVLVGAQDGYAYVVDHGGEIPCGAICIRKEWDSSFFEREIFDLYAFLDNEAVQLQEPLLLSIDSALQSAWSKGAQCIFARVPLERMGVIRTTERAGFRTYDVICRLQRTNRRVKLGSYHSSDSVREARETDVWSLVSLASSAFGLDHFHQDLEISKDAADAMYGIWIRNLFHEQACRVFIHEIDHKIGGFVTLREAPDELDAKRPKYHIDLIAVDEKHRRSGVGRRLLRKVTDEVGRDSRIDVATQASNLGAIRLYLDAGFSICSYSVTLHLWHRDLSASGARY
ncbi:MAG: hypothetical protein C4K47_10605 [Candidatus Thorarchaeota archaeon]|nr:MAG: hypothetical protein C4K47_10605 [Candidatus Thorarchaeota archaeon]